MLLEEREKMQSDRKALITGFTSFALDGDIDAAMSVMSLVDDTKSPATLALQEEWDVATEDAWYLCQRVEKSALRMLKAGDPSGAAADELDALRKTVKSLKRDLAQKDREVELLRAQIN